MICPLTVTRPAAIHFSASRREHRPVRAITLAMRCGGASLASRSARGIDERAEQAPVAFADLELGVPLHADAEPVLRRLDRFDDPVLRDGADGAPDRHVLRRLMMRAVDLHFADTDDAVQPRTVEDP